MSANTDHVHDSAFSVCLRVYEWSPKNNSFSTDGGQWRWKEFWDGGASIFQGPLTPCAPPGTSALTPSIYNAVFTDIGAFFKA